MLDHCFAVAIEAAERHLLAERYSNAIVLIEHAQTIEENPYWINFLLGRVYLGLGEKDRSEEYFVRAIETNHCSRIGAIYELLKLDFSRNQLSRRHLLDEALTLQRDVYQQYLYLSQILFMKGLVRLLASAATDAENLMQAARRFREDIDFLLIHFPWVNQALPAVPDYPQSFPQLSKLLERATHWRPVEVSYNDLVPLHDRRIFPQEIPRRFR